MSLGTKVTFIVALLPLVVLGLVNLAITAQPVLAFASLWLIGVGSIALVVRMIFGGQRRANKAYHHVSTPPVQEAAQGERGYESQYESVVVNYPRGRYD